MHEQKGKNARIRLSGMVSTPEDRSSIKAELWRRLKIGRALQPSLLSWKTKRYKLLKVWGIFEISPFPTREGGAAMTLMSDRW
ncbi:hypothetical protein [Paramesorhizobium deserti]|uniref:hypothetical protein n=1 Tax=Paramesorhizobium deserti TaxID=1494590 RepID=UPI00129017B0|nr:hypothetical protein [Paramesorhizobium deserti]